MYRSSRARQGLKHLAHLSLLPLLSLAVACGGTSSEVDAGGPGVKDAASQYRGLAFTTTDYTSSSVWFNDFATGSLSEVTTGQSGDPWLAELGSELYLFNRSSQTSNFNYQVLNTAGGAKTAQIATPQSSGSDPKGAVLLADGYLLLAMNTANKLLLVNPADGSVRQAIDGSGFDFGGGPFHPETFYVKDQTVYVLHQGLDAKFTALTFKSQLLVFTFADGKLTPGALNAAGQTVTSIPLQSSNPVAFVTSGAAPRVVGSCTPWLTGGACKAYVEELDLATQTVSTLFEMPMTAVTGNGPVVDAGDGNALAMVVKADTQENVVTKIDPIAKSLVTVHTFPAGSAGCCALYFDTSVGTLYVGDFPEKGSEIGTLTVYTAGATTADAKIIDIQGRPYSGVFLSK